ncbi:MAG TPA: hypothetical protein VFO25_00145 [Candidatus Eremiobacteraceae bacterium]|nr:hypothetical protein [Candidatus Eremiobacteraceae bacterium]
MSKSKVAEHWLVIRFYDQPPQKIAECFEALCIVASGLVNYATRPLQSTLNEGGLSPRYVGANNTECMLIFDSAASLAAFQADPRTKEIYSWFASPHLGGSVITNETHVLRPLPE